MNGRVTAGLPGLQPGLRQRIDKAGFGRERSAQLLKDEVSRETATTAPDDAFDTTSLEQQLGRPMSGGEIQRRLKLCNPAFHFEISHQDKNKTGVYIIENREGAASKRFVCGMETGVSPEFSVRLAEEKRVPNPDGSGEWLTIKSISKEVRGWRTVLAMLLRSRLISQTQADRLFATHLGRQSRNWQTLTT